MEQIGWSLVDGDGVEIQHGGDAPGTCIGWPDVLRLPNGDFVHCPRPGPIGSYQLVERRYNWASSPASPQFDGTATVVTGALDALKATLKARVGSDAEDCRLQFITPGSGKAMSYMEKHNQANAVHDMGEAAANALSSDERKAQFPTLSATVGIDAPTLWGVAQIVIARYEAWATISYDIELAEAAGKKAISDASDAAAARAAYEAITWPSP